MDYLQYYNRYAYRKRKDIYSFKPCYKWITFNIKSLSFSISFYFFFSFKPCYKWITFNIEYDIAVSIKNTEVLNLVINGLPSILYNSFRDKTPISQRFKPCYKWITFNIICTSRCRRSYYMRI